MLFYNMIQHKDHIWSVISYGDKSIRYLDKSHPIGKQYFIVISGEISRNHAILRMSNYLGPCSLIYRKHFSIVRFTFYENLMVC